jgi:hypothetical protein
MTSVLISPWPEGLSQGKPLSDTLMIEMLTPMEAQKLGHVPLTRPYREDYEHEMRWLRTVLRDMRGCNFSLVDTGRGLEVWRDKREINTIKE